MGHCEPNVFIFVTEKEAQNKFQTKKILRYFTLREENENLIVMQNVSCSQMCQNHQTFI